MPVLGGPRIRFAAFQLDTHAGELFKHGLKLKLQGHPIQILAMLLERPGDLITRVTCGGAWRLQRIRS